MSISTGFNFNKTFMNRVEFRSRKRTNKSYRVKKNTLRHDQWTNFSDEVGRCNMAGCKNSDLLYLFRKVLSKFQSC